MKNNFYISFGVWIALLPLFGIPGTWKNTLVFLSGIFLIIVALGPTILKKLQAKPKSRIKKNNPLNPPYLKGEGEEVSNIYAKEDGSESILKQEVVEKL